jgi:hypothetical protein
MTGRGWALALVTIGAAFLVPGLWAAVDPSSFASTVADFGPYNAHLIRDFAASSTTFGFGLLAAAWIPSWRTPVLVLAAIWNWLHGISHLVDIGAADPEVVGPIEAGLLLAGTVALVVLVRLDRTEET